MCNLYQMTPKNDLATYLASRVDVQWAWDTLDTSRPVAPFGDGVFIRAEGGMPAPAQPLIGEVGQWGLIRPGQAARVDLVQPRTPAGRKPAAPRPRSTNNARLEGIADKPTFRDAWRQGRRCLVPAQWYAEPNWETGRNIWWHQRREDGLPWFLAGLWSHWPDPATGELVPNFTMITCNCDGHPLLGRLHKPEPHLPPDAQDKRSLVHVPLADWAQWLWGSEADARALLHPPALADFDLSDAQRTDALLVAQREAEALAAARPAPEQGALF